ncbi:MAG TPA: hypothetical protein VMN39_03670 [Longimicrobiaceae bacterium]|nr:hypothetical protein [Longimicrobiaceae bacterium]
MLNSRAGALLPFLLAALTACGGGSPGGLAPEAPPGYAALPDTIVCVVDRGAPVGLRQIPAKKDGDDVVVLSGGAAVRLETLHPINVIAGYAGRESWLSRAEPISFVGRGYSNVGGERRVPIELLRRVGEHRGILLYAGTEDDPPPDALYVPTAPGCIFQPFVREDLIRR